MADKLTLMQVKVLVAAAVVHMESQSKLAIFPADAEPEAMADVVLDVLMDNQDIDHADFNALIHVAAYLMAMQRRKSGFAILRGENPAVRDFVTRALKAV